MASEGIICQVCGIEAPSRHVEFHQNIGALVIRYHRQVKGRLCKSCVHKKCWQMTGTTLAIGWIGTISIVIAPIFIISNTVRYLAALGMPAVPPGAKVPVLDQTAIGKIQPLSSDLVTRLNNREELTVVSRDIAKRAGVTPGQVVKYVVAISQQAQAAPPRAQGFPVIPLGQTSAPTGAAPQQAFPQVTAPPAGDGPIPLAPIPAQQGNANDGADPLLPI